MKFRLLIALTGLLLLLAGCNKSDEKVLAPMGDAAPALGSAGKTDMQSFVVGDWCYIDDTGAPVTTTTYSFTSDGKFKCGGEQDHWTSTGTWTANGNVVSLTYETMKGKPLEDFRAEYKKDEEGGGQVAVRRALLYDGLFDLLAKQNALWVDEDQKHLVFSDPSQRIDPNAGNGGGEMGGLADMLKDKSGLERMSESKSE